MRRLRNTKTASQITLSICTEMAFAPQRGPDPGRILGIFREDDHGHTFEYAERFGFPDDFHPEMPHVVFVGRETRLAHVKKTILTMVNGDEAIEKWSIKSHREYK